MMNFRISGNLLQNVTKLCINIKIIILFIIATLIFLTISSDFDCVLKMLTNPIMGSPYTFNESTFSKSNIKSKADLYYASLEEMKVDFLRKYNKITSEPSCLNDFEIMETLGFGAFGKVVLARHKMSDKYYAMKIMSKSKIMKDKQLEHTKNEKEIAMALQYPFIVNMEFCFKDNCNIYFVLPFVPGGDMFTHLRKRRVFKENIAQFYAAQVALALEYMHYLNVIYRDLKPENIVIDTSGYLKLTDLGFTKLINYRTYTLCGTPEYIAPEIILSRGYGKAVDWWSFGVLVYEMLSGTTPFYSPETIKIYEKITSGRVKFNSYFAPDAKDLIRKVLQIDLTKRYGNLKNGAADIKNHVFFINIDWQALYDRRLSAPFIPRILGPGDITNFDTYKSVELERSTTDKFPNEFSNF